MSLKSVDQDAIMKAVEEEYSKDEPNKTVDNSQEDDEENLCLL